MTLIMVGLILKMPAATKTNNMAGPLVNMTDGTNPVTTTIMTTTTHSPIKSVSMRYSPLPSQSLLRLILFHCEQSSYHPQHHSQGKKKPSRTPYKPAYTQKPGNSKDQKSHRSDREAPVQEGEVYRLDSSREEWISQVQFALNHRSRIQAACELPDKNVHDR